MNDLNFAVRQWLKNPGFTVVAVLSLALGIAANTTIFSFVNTLLLRPPPVQHPDELWQIWQLRPKASSETKRFGVWGPAEIAYLRDHNQSFAGLGAFEIEPSFKSWSQNGVGEAVQSLAVTGNFFDLCGVQPALGRFFLPVEDQTPGTHPVVVVSHEFWRNRLAADRQAVGRPLMINGIALTVIGVAPETFAGTMAGIAPDLWVPFMMVPAVSHNTTWLTRTDSHSVVGLGRLKPGVNEAQAAADLTALTHRFQEEIKGRTPEDGAILTPSLMVPVPLRGFVWTFTAMLMGAVLLVLLIACANAANLQLARAAARRREMAVRLALGARRSRLIRQLLTESVMLAMMGGALGLMLSIGLAKLIVGLVPTTLPLRFDLTLDWRVLGFTAFVSLGTGILFGLAPAFRGTGEGPSSALKDESRGMAVRRSRLANALIVGQMALCLVLLLAATLCLRSLFNARLFDPGFEVKGRVTADFNLNDFGYSTAQAEDFYARLLGRMESLPEVRSVAWTRHLPLGTEHSNGSFQFEGLEPGTTESGFFELFGVGPGYFTTLGTELLQGREFTAADRTGAPRVVIINEAVATRYWPGQNPLGRRLYAGEVRAENAREIVGVVPTGRYRTLGEDPKPAFFECFLQGVPSHATLVAHVRGDPQPVLTAIREATRQLDPRLALTSLTTLEQHLTVALFPVRTSGALLGALGIVALVLAVSGLFGVLTYSVSQRTHEVGIRLALGAQRREVQRLIVRQGMRLALVGVGIGLVGSLAATQVLRSLLLGISPTDPATFVAIPLLLLGVAWLACWLPARRAARVNPVVALRE
ncbi:MAG: ABC transporter permease [Verrucomicrobia bacterium]|nr:ABC transporter permease [Verrucomicrobiota bacterium]